MVSAAKSVLVGSRNTGKTRLVLHLLKHLKASAHVISGVDYDAVLYNKIDGVSCFHDEYDPALVASWIGSPIVLDDCMYYPEQFQTRAFQNLISDKSSSFFLTVLYGTMAIEPSQFDYIFLFRDPILSNRKKLYPRYTGAHFPSFDAFCAAMEMLDCYDCLVLDNVNGLVFGYSAK
jgi:hypothetical protein